MHSSSRDVDELIETEVCNRLISLSCAKMVNSKNERGGAKLRRNLLILHLLRRARSEQHRPPALGHEYMNLSSPEDCSEGASVPSNAPFLQCQDDGLGMYAHAGAQVIYGNTSSIPYYDYVNNSSGIVTSDDMSQHLRYDNNRLQLQVKFGNAGSGAGGTDTDDDADVEIPMRLSMPVPVQCSLYDNEPCAYHQQQHQSPRAGADAEADDDEEASTYESDNDCNDDGNGDEDGNYGSDSFRHHRKRKTSMSSSQTCASTTPKKCCVEERQFTGLMSVFNSGLSVVADQLLPTAAPEPLLQTTSDQLVPSLVRIACNPLIC